MLENRIPLFEQGRILKKEALEQLRDYPLELTELFFSEYSDGIVNGLSLRYKDGRLYVEKGILKHDGALYLLTEEQFFLISSYGRECILRICVEETKRTQDYYSKRFFAELGVKEELEERTAYELGRFRLEKGARLRTREEYLDFQDASTQINTLGIHHQLFAGKGGPTLSPILTGLYARELLKIDGLFPLDAAFCMTCLNERAMARDLIIQYLYSSNIMIPPNAGPQDLYLGLLKLLKERRRKDALPDAGRIKSRRTVIE